MHDGDVQFCFEPLFDFKGLWRFDVFEVDAAKGGGDGLDRIYKAVHIRGVHLDVKHIDVGKDLKEHTLALHHRLAGLGANVAQTEYGGAVADDRHQVAFARVAVDVFGVFGDFEAGFSHTGGVGEREVALRGGGLGGDDFQLSGASLFVVIQGFLLADFRHNSRLSGQN